MSPSAAPDSASLWLTGGIYHLRDGDIMNIYSRIYNYFSGKRKLGVMLFCLNCVTACT